MKSHKDPRTSWRESQSLWYRRAGEQMAAAVSGTWQWRDSDPSCSVIFIIVKPTDPAWAVTAELGSLSSALWLPGVQTLRATSMPSDSCAPCHPPIKLVTPVQATHRCHWPDWRAVGLCSCQQGQERLSPLTSWWRECVPWAAARLLGACWGLLCEKMLKLKHLGHLVDVVLAWHSYMSLWSHGKCCYQWGIDGGSSFTDSSDWWRMAQRLGCPGTGIVQPGFTTQCSSVTTGGIHGVRAVRDLLKSVGTTELLQISLQLVVLEP